MGSRGYMSPRGKGFYTVWCHVCKKQIGFYGWANHVRKEKKRFGNDIYIRLRREREERARADKPVVLRANRGKTLKEISLDEFDRRSKP